MLKLENQLRDVEHEETDIKSLSLIFAAVQAAKEATGDCSVNLPQIDLSDMTLIRELACAPMEHRRHEMLRTISVVALYMFQVVSAFVPAVGASSSPSGGRIGPSMLLSWLVSIILLSNAVGDFSLPESTKKSMLALGLERKMPTSPWSGAIYSYRPRKTLRNSGWKLAVMSLFPAMIASGTAFMVLEAGPTYFSCRSLFVIGAFGFWILSAVMTYILTYILILSRLATGKHLWYAILTKDFLIAAPILGLIVASSCGYWNTCYCWGGGPVHGDQAQIQLNSTNVFNFNGETYYPAVVGTGLGLQVLVFLAMLAFGYDGFKLMGLRLPFSRFMRNGAKVTMLDSLSSVGEVEPERELRELSCLDMFSKDPNIVRITLREGNEV